MAGKTTETKGKFPVDTGPDKSKRFIPPGNTKAHSSIDRNKGEFPVKTSRGTEKRFIPPK